MGLSLAEDQALRAEAQKRKLVFQFGTQQRSSREFQRAIELVRNGRIGKVYHLDVWAPASRPGGSTQETPPPPGLDYNFWLGPAPQTPHTDGKVMDNPTTGQWKTWWYNYDYALGFVAGWGVHPLDIALWGHPAMMTSPMDIAGKGLIPTEGACNTAVAWDLMFTFGDAVTMRYRGTANEYGKPLLMHDFADLNGRYAGNVGGHGTAFVGTEGWVEVHRGGLRTFPAPLAEEPPTGDFRVRHSDSHQKDWVDSILLGRPAVSNIEESVQADLLCHLSDIAIRLDRKLRFDPVKEKFLGDAEANRRLALRPMRAPWNLG